MKIGRTDRLHLSRGYLGIFLLTLIMIENLQVYDFILYAGLIYFSFIIIYTGPN